MSKFIKVTKWICNTAVKYISLYFSMLVPKSRKIMVFGSWFGAKYADNSRYLYEYVVTNRKDIKALWLTENINVYNYLKERQYPVRMSNTLGSVLTVLRARYIFTVTGRRDIGRVNCNFIGNSININLWHGIPLKKIMYDNEYESTKSLKDKLSSALEKLPMRKYYVVSTSETITEIYKSAFRKDKDHILQLGQPRNDYFFTEHKNPYREKFAGKTIILYMPTHRNEGKTEMNLNELLDLDKLDELCQSTNSIFLIRKHFYHKDDTPLNKKYTAVFDITYEVAEAQVLMDGADILITDYSSCYIDYLLLNRPIIFYNYDMEYYQKNDRKLYFEYDKVTPGNKCKSFSDLYNELKNVLQGKDDYISKRKETCSLFYEEDNCRIVSDKIIDYIEKM